MKYFTEEPHGNFTKDCLGEAEGSAATRGSAQTVRGKIAMGLQLKYFMNFVLFSVAIVTYFLYGLVLGRPFGTRPSTNLLHKIATTTKKLLTHAL